MTNIFNTDFTVNLPDILKNNDDIYAFAKAFSEQLQKNINLTKNIIIYANIDNLTEEVLNELAINFKVDWYDTAYDINTKRQIIKNCILVHKYKGTRFAVETAISNVQDCTLKEWYEYNGTPFSFIINFEISNRAVSNKTILDLIDKINYYKNTRSHLDGIIKDLISTADYYSAAVTTKKMIITAKELIYITLNDEKLTDGNDNKLMLEI